MNNLLIRCKNLMKQYGNFMAIDHVSIELHRGEIYGLIGKNGAGKTTLMRMLVGLSIPSSGRTIFLEQEDEKSKQSKVGCMIENPSIVPYLTAQENLQLHQILRGLKKSSCESELNLVGLSVDKKKKAKDFSLGMKQRLGIAIALLGDPELIILDEPVNGLDPIGVAEIRDLLRDLSKQKNRTILISSHNLPELYQVATQYIFIDKGKIIKSMSLAELEKESNPHVSISCHQMERLVEVLKSKLQTDHFKIVSDDEVELYDYLNDREYISKTLMENNIVITSLRYQEETLENYFLSLVGGERNA